MATSSSTHLRTQLDDVLRRRLGKRVVLGLRLRALLGFARRARRILDRRQRVDLLRGEDAGGLANAGEAARAALAGRRLLLRCEVVLEHARLGASHRSVRVNDENGTASVISR
jgi:hypothetical protein